MGCSKFTANSHLLLQSCDSVFTTPTLLKKHRKPMGSRISTYCTVSSSAIQKIFFQAQPLNHASCNHTLDWVRRLKIPCFLTRTTGLICSFLQDQIVHHKTWGQYSHFLLSPKGRCSSARSGDRSFRACIGWRRNSRLSAIAAPINSYP